MTAVAWSDPSPLLVAHTSRAEGDLIDQLRGECGFILQTVDWVARKLGYDLIGAIFDPIAGDFGAVDGMRQDWHGIAGALQEIGENYTSMADSLPAIWKGDDADAAARRLRDMAEGHGVQAEAAALMSRQLGNMLQMVTEACKLVAGVLAVLEELILSFSLAKWAKEILTMGSGVRRAISLIDRAIQFIKNLNNVIPPLMKAAGLLSTMFRSMNLAFMLPVAIGEHHDSAGHIDDTAAAGFNHPAFDGKPEA